MAAIGPIPRLRRTLPRNIGEGKNNISGVWMAGNRHPYPRPHKSAMDFKNRRVDGPGAVISPGHLIFLFQENMKKLPGQIGI